MVQRYSPQDSSGSYRTYGGLRFPTSLGGYSEKGIVGGCFRSSYFGRYSDDQWYPYPSAGLRLPWPSPVGREVGGVMLSISGLHNFYFIRNFCDMRCKYDRVLSIIHRQFSREPSAGDVFIMMSKDRRKVRLFNYDARSCSLHEKRFHRDYEFMKVLHDDEKEIYSIRWEDVVLLLESPVIKQLNVK